MITRIYTIPINLDNEDITVLQHFYAWRYPTKEPTDENVKQWITDHINASMNDILQAFKDEVKK